MTALEEYHAAARRYRRVLVIARLTGCMAWPSVQRMLRRLEWRAARAKDRVHDSRIDEAVLRIWRKAQ